MKNSLIYLTKQITRNHPVLCEESHWTTKGINKIQIFQVPREDLLAAFPKIDAYPVVILLESSKMVQAENGRIEKLVARRHRNPRRRHSHKAGAAKKVPES